MLLLNRIKHKLMSYIIKYDSAKRVVEKSPQTPLVGILVYTGNKKEIIFFNSMQRVLCFNRSNTFTIIFAVGTMRVISFAKTVSGFRLGDLLGERPPRRRTII